MESTRQSKISRLIQKELSEIFLLEAKSMPGVILTVSAVRVTPDLSIAYVHLSIFPSEKGKDMINGINENAKTVRYDLGKRLRHQLLIIPELKFFLDESLDYFEKIDELLK